MLIQIKSCLLFCFYITWDCEDRYCFQGCRDSASFFFLQSGKLNVNNVCESINNSMKSLNAELNCSILLWETRQSKCFAICSPPISRQFSHILRFTGLVSPATVWWIIYESHTAAEKPQMNVIVFSETLWAHLQVINPLK